MSITQDYPQNVPDATKGEAVSVAAPGSAGVGGTKSRFHKAGCTCVTCDFPADYSMRFDAAGFPIAFAMVALLGSRSVREQALNLLMLELEGMKQGAFA